MCFACQLLSNSLLSLPTVAVSSNVRMLLPVIFRRRRGMLAFFFFPLLQERNQSLQSEFFNESLEKQPLLESGVNEFGGKRILNHVSDG
jgi:hypothetical protein